MDVKCLGASRSERVVEGCRCGCLSCGICAIAGASCGAIAGASCIAKFAKAVKSASITDGGTVVVNAGARAFAKIARTGLIIGVETDHGGQRFLSTVLGLLTLFVQEDAGCAGR